MLRKISIFIIIAGFFSFTVFYFAFSESYQKSLEARVFYFLGDYGSAYSLSKESYRLDPFNRMAFMVMTQSKIAFKYEEYIKTGVEYLKKIESISSKKEFDNADKARVKMMCEVMIEEYKKLSPTVLTEASLMQEAKKIYMKFKKIYEELF